MNNIYNEDCFEGILKIKEDYCIITDPPFNVGYNYNEYKDKLPEDIFYERLSNLIRDKKAVVIMYPEMLHKLSIKLGYAPTKVISWVYNANTPKEHRDIAFYNIKPDLSQIKQPYKNLNDKRIQQRIADGSEGTNIYDWWHVDQVKNVNFDKYEHPCQMPLQIMQNIVKILPDEKVILDPFSGSGTTLLAAKKEDRNYIGFEIDKKYIKIIEDRLNGIMPNGQCSML